MKLVRWLTLQLMCTLAAVAIAQASPGQIHEQTTFSAENEGVDKPVPVPDDVLLLLAGDRRVRNTMEDSDPALKAPPQDWFSASVIHLGSRTEEDLIVQAKGPLRGANVDMFWVFLRTSSGPVMVLNAAAHDLVVMKTRWSGHRNIELLSATAVECSTTVLRFNGSEYVVYRDKSGPIPNC